MKKHKYRAKKTIIDNIRFDSKLEASYYTQLKLRKKYGQIRSFELQPSFVLQPAFKHNGKTIREIKYIADFLVIDNDGNETVIDIKGKATREALLKKKLFFKKYPEKPLLWLKRSGNTWVEY